MGPFGSSVASTFLWMSLTIPYIFGTVVRDYRFTSMMHLVLVPLLVSIYISVNTITPYFLVPWQIMVPLLVVLYGVIMLISLISTSYRQAAQENPRASWASRGYLALTIALILFLGMLAYYYTALWQFSPLPLQMMNGN